MSRRPIKNKVHYELEKRLAHADKEHPEGPNLQALLDEVAEAVAEFEEEFTQRFFDELLDVAVVALRMCEEMES